MANNIKNSEMNDLVAKSELLRIMECPVCQEMPFPPIFQCIKGHSVCKNCKPKLKECPTCRGSLSAETRNYMVEQLVLASKHSCCYKEDGCHTELRGELIENHMNNCSYRPFKCPWFGRDMCSADLLRLSLAKDHIFNFHSNTASMGPTKTVHCSLDFRQVVDDGSLRRLRHTKIWPSNPIEFDKKLFFLHAFGMSQTVCFNVLCIGSEEEAQKYRVKIICQPDKEMEFQWTVPVTAITKGAELMNTETRHDVFISSCTLDNLIQMAETNEDHRMYRFTTRYTILKRECE